MTIELRPPTAAGASRAGRADPAVTDLPIGVRPRWWVIALQACGASMSAVILAVFAFLPPERPLAADSILISSPQSIGGRS